MPKPPRLDRPRRRALYAMLSLRHFRAGAMLLIIPWRGWAPRILAQRCSTGASRRFFVLANSAARRSMALGSSYRVAAHRRRPRANGPGGSTSCSLSDIFGPARCCSLSLRSPELPCRSKPEYRENGIGAAGDITIGGQQPLHQPGGGCGSVCRSICAAPESSATSSATSSAPPREGIKNTIAPAGNVGARARCRVSGAVMPILPAACAVR